MIRSYLATLLLAALCVFAALVPLAACSTFPEAVHEELQRMLARPLTDDVIAWRASEAALMKRVQGARG